MSNTLQIFGRLRSSRTQPAIPAFRGMKHDLAYRIIVADGVPAAEGSMEG